VDISLKRSKGRRDRNCLKSDSIRMKLAEAIGGGWRTGVGGES
jgi:hypothetical protein